MRKDEIRIHHNLENGQHAAVYFQRWRHKVNGVIHIDWYMSFMIGKSARQCNDWYCDKGNNNRIVQTGKCGISGLIWAKEQMIQFMRDHHSDYKIQRVLVDGCDDQRVRVYGWLKRLGFTREDDSTIYTKEF